MRAAVLAVMALVLVSDAVTLASQSRPDFSGRWTSEPEAASAPGGLARGGGGGAVADPGSGWGSTITLTQTSAALTVEYAFFGRGDLQPPLRFVYQLEGSPSTNSVMMGRGRQVQTSRVSWKAGTLLITTTHVFADPASGKPATAEVIQTLTLESPASLVVETTRVGVLGGPPSTSRTVYRKLS